MGKLDDASWHNVAAEEGEDSPDERGGTHIGMFIAWAVRKGHWRDMTGPDASARLEALRRRTQSSGRRVPFDHCDGKLLSEMLNPQGARFAEDYYPRRYLRDYQRTLTPENNEKIVSCSGRTA
jgi:hypothetical protein